MSGTVEGGIQTRETIRELFGPEFYQRIGAKGGRNGRTGGFYANRELARIAGSIGGQRRRHERNAGHEQRIAETYARLSMIQEKARRLRNSNVSARHHVMVAV